VTGSDNIALQGAAVLYSGGRKRVSGVGAIQRIQEMNGCKRVERVGSGTVQSATWITAITAMPF